MTGTVTTLQVRATDDDRRGRPRRAEVVLPPEIDRALRDVVLSWVTELDPQVGARLADAEIGPYGRLIYVIGMWPALGERPRFGRVSEARRQAVEARRRAREDRWRRVADVIAGIVQREMCEARLIGRSMDDWIARLRALPTPNLRGRAKRRPLDAWVANALVDDLIAALPARLPDISADERHADEVDVARAIAPGVAGVLRRWAPLLPTAATSDDDPLGLLGEAIVAATPSPKERRRSPPGRRALAEAIAAGVLGAAPRTIRRHVEAARLDADLARARPHRLPELLGMRRAEGTLPVS
jgi:hypothetical protein